MVVIRFGVRNNWKARVFVEKTLSLGGRYYTAVLLANLFSRVSKHNRNYKFKNWRECGTSFGAA